MEDGRPRRSNQKQPCGAGALAREASTVTSDNPPNQKAKPRTYTNVIQRLPTKDLCTTRPRNSTCPLVPDILIPYILSFRAKRGICSSPSTLQRFRKQPPSPLGRNLKHRPEGPRDVSLRRPVKISRRVED